jgi:hypothetical protein
MEAQEVAARPSYPTEGRRGERAAEPERDAGAVTVLLAMVSEAASDVHASISQLGEALDPVLDQRDEATPGIPVQAGAITGSQLGNQLTEVLERLQAANLRLRTIRHRVEL